MTSPCGISAPCLYLGDNQRAVDGIGRRHRGHLHNAVPPGMRRTKLKCLLLLVDLLRQMGFHHLYLHSPRIGAYRPFFFLIIFDLRYQQFPLANNDEYVVGCYCHLYQSLLDDVGFLLHARSLLL